MEQNSLSDLRTAINDANTALNVAIGASLLESARCGNFSLTDELRDIGISLDNFINGHPELFDWM